MTTDAGGGGHEGRRLLPYHGEALQLIHELNGAVWKLSDTDDGCKHFNYFRDQQGPDGLRALPSLRVADRQRLGGGSVQVRRGPALQGQRHALAAARQRIRAAHPPRGLAVLNGELDRYFQPRQEVRNEAA